MNVSLNFPTLTFSSKSLRVATGLLLVLVVVVVVVVAGDVGGV